MAVRSLARSGVNTGNGKYVSFLAGNAAYIPGSDFLIEENILASGVASVTFSSIPQTYKHLQVRISARSNDAAGNDGLSFRFNGTTSGYVRHALYGSGTAVGSFSATAQDYLVAGTLTGNGFASNGFGSTIVDILDYSSTVKNKTTRSLTGLAGGTDYVYAISGLYASTTAISSLTINPFNGSQFMTGSRFSLYGSNG